MSNNEEYLIDPSFIEGKSIHKIKVKSDKLFGHLVFDYNCYNGNLEPYISREEFKKMVKGVNKVLKNIGKFKLYAMTFILIPVALYYMFKDSGMQKYFDKVNQELNPKGCSLTIVAREDIVVGKPRYRLLMHYPPSEPVNEQ